MTRLQTTYDGGMSVVRRSRAVSPTGRLSRRHQMTVLELIIVVLHCRKDGRVDLCVFVHDIVRYVEHYGRWTVFRLHARLNIPVSVVIVNNK